MNANGEITHNVNASSGVMIVNNSNSTYNNDTQSWIQNNAGIVTGNTGDIYSNHYGLGIRNYHNGSVIITTGNITENGKPFAFEGNSITGQTPYTRKYLPDKQTFLNEYRPVGFFINNYNGGYIDLSTGFIESMSNGIYINNTDEDSAVNVKTGNITAKGETISHNFSSGAYVTNLNGAETDLITGNLASTGSGISLYSSGEDSRITAETGDITANGETIIVPNSYTYYDAEGNPITYTYNSTYSAIGVKVKGTNGGTSELTTGNVTTQGQGIYAISSGDDSEVFLTVDGNISAGYTGINADNSHGIMSISVLGDVSSQNSTGTIISASNEGKTSVSVDGDITSENNLGVSLSVYGESEAGLSVNGDVLAAGEGTRANGMSINAYDNSQSNVSVEGDIRTTAEEGIGLSVYSRDDSIVDVLVAGTIAGNQVGVSLGQTASDEEGNRYGDPTTAENFKLTVWQIELNEEGHAAESTNYRLADMGEAGTVIKEHETVYGEAEQEFEKSILYIIKVEQPAEGATLQATDAEGNALEKSHDYEVAHEGETVLMKVNIQSGFELLGAYNGLGEKVPLLRDKTGNFYIEVPKGGGVYLSAKLGRIPSDSELVFQPEENDDDEEKPLNTVYPAAYSYNSQSLIRTAEEPAEQGTLTVAYDLNGGYFEDPQQPVNFKVIPGQTHVMSTAPVRDGYRFLFWAGAPFTRSDKNWVEPDLNNSYPYMPGSWFTVPTTDWTFTAVWAEIL